MSCEWCLAVPAKAIGAKGELDTEFRQLVSKRLEAVGLLDTKMSYSREREGFTSNRRVLRRRQGRRSGQSLMCAVKCTRLAFLCSMGDAYPCFGLLGMNTQLLKELYKIGRIPLQGGECESRELNGRAYGARG